MKFQVLKKFTAALLTMTVIFCNANALIFANAAEKNTLDSQTQINYKGERKLDFDSDWKFHWQETTNEKEMIDASAQNYDDSGNDWKPVDLPHDWCPEMGFNENGIGNTGFSYGGTGWYRKTFTLPDELEGKKIDIQFDGVHMLSDVWINGTHLGQWPYGYTTFNYDLTPYLKFDGENTVAVRVVNRQPNSRWYSGGGINRNVWLNITNDVHVDRFGTYVTTPKVTEENATVKVETKVKNDAVENKSVKVKSIIMDNDNNEVTFVESENSTDIASGDVEKISQELSVANPKLWSTDSPNLYTMKTEVYVDDTLTDTYDTTFGIRYFNFDPDNGFTLNGVSMKLNGVCMHSDLGCLGTVSNYAGYDRQIKILKGMGVNAIRTSHNPPAPEFLTACERNGILVMDEAFDCWEKPKNTNDYHSYFNEWAQRDIQTMVDRDKNSPSVIIWSIGNEIEEVFTDNSKGVEIAKKLKDWVEEIDKTRPITNGVATWAGVRNITNEINDLMDVQGYNYGEYEYSKAHLKYPDWCIYGSETASAFYSRGIYHRDTIDKGNVKIHDDKQSSCYGTEYAFNTAENALKTVRDNDYVSGEFVWTGFDYGGEPTPYPSSKSSYFGIVDTAGFEKDPYYLYKSMWTDEDVVHLVPQNWNYTTGETIPVIVYTNAAKVELFLNDKSLGEKNFDIKTASDLHLRWNVKYEPGTLKAVAKNKDGNVIATDIVKTTGDAQQIILKSNRGTVKSDGKDLAFIEADIADGYGLTCPDAANRVTFNVENGTVIGYDNGDPTDFDSYIENGRRAFSGKCMAVVRPDESGKPITVTATSKTDAGELIESNTIEIKTQEEDLSTYQTEIVEVQPVEVSTSVGKSPVLPETVNAVYDDGSLEETKVKWDAIDSSDYASEGTFEIEGTVENTSIKALATISVSEIESIKPVKVITIAPTAPTLPTSVMEVLKDGSKIPADVITWNSIDEKQYAKAGSFDVEGTVENTDIKAVANVIVKEVATTSISGKSVTTIAGTAPTMPSKIEVTFKDKTKANYPITWDFTGADFDFPGSVTVKGKLANTSCTIEANVIVKAGQYLSDLPWKTAITDWQKVQNDKSTDGNALTIREQAGGPNITYAKGIGTHANSTIEYDLAEINKGKGFDTFEAYVGVDVESGGGTVVFSVLVDGVEKYNSDLCNNMTPQQYVNVPIKDAQKLTLCVDKTSDDNGQDHADWCNARLLGDNITMGEYDGSKQHVVTTVGKAPVMPKGIKTTYSDGSTMLSKVNWRSIPESSYMHPCKFQVAGTLVDTGATVYAEVYVEEPNLLGNGDFQDEDTGWETFNASVSNQQLMLDTSQTAYATQNIPVQPGETYNLVADVIKAEDDSSVTFTVLNGGTVISKFTQIAGSKLVTPTKMSFMVPKDVTEVTVKIEAETPSKSGLVGADNISVQKQSDTSPIYDDLYNLANVYEKSEGMMLEKLSPGEQSEYGFTNGFYPNGTKDGYVVYKLNDLSDFAVRSTAREASIADNNNLKFSTSKDNITYTLFTNVSKTTDPSAGWAHRIYKNASPLPDGTKYLKIEYPIDIDTEHPLGLEWRFNINHVELDNSDNSVIDQTVTALDKLDASVTSQKVANGTPISSLNLPKTLKATVNGKKEILSGVTWASNPAYNSAKAGAYTFTAVLPNEYVLGSGVELPKITITVAAHEDSEDGSSEHHPSHGGSSDDKPTTALPGCKSDTTNDLTVHDTYQFKITSTNGSVPNFVIGTPGVFKTELVSHNGNDYFYKVTAIGKAGQQAGVYVNGGSKLLVLTVGHSTKDTPNCISDTTDDLTVHGTYQFKITSTNGAVPTFVIGTSGVFKTELVSHNGNDYFYKVTAIGKAGQKAGVYVNGGSKLLVLTVG